MSLIVADYDCPQCGRIERTIERDANGDPPEFVTCGQVFDCGERFAETYGVATCDQFATWTISAPKPRVLTVRPTAAVRGKPDPAPRPTYMNTEKLADGQTPAEFAKERAKVWREERERQIRKTVST